MTLDALACAVEPYTVVDAQRLTALAGFVSDVVARVPGDVVECGTASGGSAAVLAHGLLGTDRHLWCFDTFTGLPAPTEVDGDDASAYTGANATDLETVWTALRLSQLPDRQIHLRPGLFAETFPPADRPETVALLHIDADWYDSVALALAHWYDRVPLGGVIVLDDFGYWPGCRQAVYDFCATRRIAPDLQRIGREQAHWVKGDRG